jgi:hypothetical protein
MELASSFATSADSAGSHDALFREICRGDGKKGNSSPRRRWSLADMESRARAI